MLRDFPFVDARGKITGGQHPRPQKGLEVFGVIRNHPPGRIGGVCPYHVISPMRLPLALFDRELSPTRSVALVHSCDPYSGPTEEAIELGKISIFRKEVNGKLTVNYRGNHFLGAIALQPIDEGSVLECIRVNHDGQEGQSIGPAAEDGGARAYPQVLPNRVMPHLSSLSLSSAHSPAV